MDLFEEIWYDDSYSKLPRSYRRDNIDALLYYIKGSNESPSERSYYMHDDFRRFIKKFKFTPPATIVFWTDNTKTVVKCSGEDYDPEKGLAMCICKKMLGNKGNYYEVFKKWLPKEEDSDVVQKVLEHIKPQTFEFELKPIDINQRLFEVLTGVPGTATIQFDATKKSEPDKKSIDKEKEESKPHSCQWVPKDE